MIEKLMNTAVKCIKPYPTGEADNCNIILDKNENPYDITELLRDEINREASKLSLNRYPDGSYKILREELSKYTGVNADNIIIGNGSDELIYMIMQAFVEKGERLLQHAPTFAMYKNYAQMVGGIIIEYQTDDKFRIDIEAFKKAIIEAKPKILIICNPNNPTGGHIEIEAIEYLIQDFQGIVIIDEAYMEFFNDSAVKLIENYENVIILRTFSKALGLAGLRIGYMLCSSAVSKCVERAKSPFNVNNYSQTAAITVLRNMQRVREKIAEIIAERDLLINELSGIKDIEVFETSTNFILIRASKHKEIQSSLLSEGIAIKSFGDAKLKNCFRITVGTSSENQKLLRLIKEVYSYG